MSSKNNVFPEVAVLGAAAVDWIARVDDFPAIDGITFADQYSPFVGGSGGNVAEGIARLGHSVRFFGVLGDDENGKLLHQAFTEAGVDTSCIQVKSGQRSAACFIAVNKHGQRIIFALGGVALYDPEVEMTNAQMAGIKILYIADAHGETALNAITNMDTGAHIIFSPGGLMVAHGESNLRVVIEHSDILILNEREAERLSGKSNSGEACQAISELGPKSIVLTLGDRGALVYDNKQITHIPAVPVKTVVDTTGAGDAFSAGLVAGLLEGKGLQKAALLGCAAAAHKIAFFGSRSGLPDRNQLQQWL